MKVSLEKTGGCGMKPWMQNVWSTYTGSSSIEGFFRRMPSVYSIYGGGSFMNCNYFAGSYINGGWNNGLPTFADIVENRTSLKWYQPFLAGLYEQAYLNPIGTAGTGIMVAGAGLGIFGNLANALANFGQNKQC